MDLQAAWDRLLAAYAEGDWETVEESAMALSQWLRKDGFPPVVLGNPSLGPEFEGVLAKAACAFVLDVLRARWVTSSLTQINDRKEHL